MMQLSWNMKKTKQLKMISTRMGTCQRLKYLAAVNYKLSQSKAHKQ